MTFVKHGKEGFFKISFVNGPEKWSLATLNTIWTGGNFCPIYIINFFEILNIKSLSPVLPILPHFSNSCSLFKITMVTHTYINTHIYVYTYINIYKYNLTESVEYCSYVYEFQIDHWYWVTS